MIRQMERSTIQVLVKRGKSLRQIAKELGLNFRTVARAAREPVDQKAAPRQRRSIVDPYREQITVWLEEGLSVVRMLELARTNAESPYTGGRSQFGEMVRRVRQARDQAQAAADVAVRFEGLPAEYLQVDWGEVRAFPFTGQPRGTRYFLACRLKYSRWSWVRWTQDMRQETLFRGLVECLCTLGWVPWVLVFDNMKTVTSGRDPDGQPIWTPALVQLAGEFGFHPQACDPGAGNQKGSVESLVKWVKGNFLAGRTFSDDADLGEQAQEWESQANVRVSAATGAPPRERLPDEAAQGTPLPATAADYGVLVSAVVSADALVAVLGNRYSVPVTHVGAPVVGRVHRTRVRLWRDTLLVADHERRPDGARQRVVDPAHFAALFPRKPRAQVMLYRAHLLELGGVAPAFLSALSYRHRAQLRSEILAVYALYTQYGADESLAAMALAVEAGTYNAAGLALLLQTPARAATPLPLLLVPGVPRQAEIDRPLSVYDAWVQIDEAVS
jgi:transposase